MQIFFLKDPEINLKIFPTFIQNAFLTQPEKSPLKIFPSPPEAVLSGKLTSTLCIR